VTYDLTKQLKDGVFPQTKTDGQCSNIALMLKNGALGKNGRKLNGTIVTAKLPKKQ
jgi:hypothetical protein